MKALMIRQMMGCAMLCKVRDQREAMIQKTIKDLRGILELFLPRQADLRPSLNRIIRAAVNLADQIAEEQALFCWPLSEERETSTERKVEETPAEEIFLCTFPGLQRRKMEGTFLTLVEPFGERETLFAKAQRY